MPSSEVYLGVGIDATGAKVGSRAFVDSTNRMVDGASKADKATAKLKQQLNRAKVALLAAGAAASYFTVKTITEYTRALSEAQAVTGANAQQMRQLEQATRQLGATTEFSASQAAEAVKFLGMAGFETNEILAALPATLDLAAAAGLSMGQAADIASNIMSGFGIEAKRMTEVADAMASVASNANTSVQQLGEAMKYVGPVAKSVGISMQDTAAAIGVLSNSGIQGSMAGTGLKTALSSLVNPSKKARDAISAMGLTIDQVNPQTQKFQDVIKRLADAGMTANQAFQIFGQRGATAMLALTSNVPMLDKLTKSTNESAGAAERMAKIMRDNLAGDVKLLFSALSELALKIGQSGVTGSLRGLIQAATETVTYLNELYEKTQENTVAMNALRIAVGSLAVSMGTLMALKLAAWLYGVATAAGAAALAFAATPFGAIAIGFALITASIYAVYKAAEALPALIGKSGGEVLKEIEIAAAKVSIYIINFFDALYSSSIDWALKLGSNIKDAIVMAWKDGISAASLHFRSDMADMVDDVAGKITVPKNTMNEMLKDVFKIDVVADKERNLADARAGGIMLAKNFADGLSSMKAEVSAAAESLLPNLFGSDLKEKMSKGGIAAAATATANSASPKQDKNFFQALGPCSTPAADPFVKEKMQNQNLINSLKQANDEARIRNELTTKFKGNLEEVNFELSVREQLQKLNSNATEADAKAIRNAMESTRQLTKATNETSAAARRAQQSQRQWANEMTYAFKNAIMNSKNLGEALSNLANKVQSMLVNKALDSLLGGLFSFIGGGSGGSVEPSVFAAAHGAAFSGGNIMPYAKGGIVDRPTFFGMSGNRAGVMGEAGSEAVMPLGRTSSGDLGVKVAGAGGSNIALNNVFNIEVSGGSREENEEAAGIVSREVRKQMDDFVMEILVREKRNGGVL